MHIANLAIYDQSSAPGGRVTFKQILQFFEHRMHKARAFRQRIARVPLSLDHPYWIEDPDFDLEFHVRHIALPKPGDWRQLCILAARLHARPLSRDKPLWEIYIIEGLDAVEGLPKNCFAMLMKVHHAAMDGASGAQFNSIMHDLEPTPRAVAPAPPWVVESPSALRMLGKAYLDAWKKPGQVYRMARSALPTYLRIRKGYQDHQFEHLDEIPTTRFQGKISPHRAIEACKFDFAEIRAIRNALPGATINDVMLAIVSGGLRKYLDSKGETPENSLVAGCPIDVRSVEERSAGGNMVGFMNVALCSDVEDPFRRLQAISQKTNEAKAYAQALGPRIALDITDLIPGSVLAVALRTAAATGLAESSVMLNTIVTNVPGAMDQLYLCGAAQIDAISLGPLVPNVGLFHIVYSSVQNKKGTITLSVTACREMMPDPAFYIDCLKDAFEELKRAIADAAPARRTGASRKKRK
jgi:WS/DGAT/MGAT family acyltransferase